MKLFPTRHEDERRILTEYISGIEFKRAKVLEIKEKCILGKHYHNKNDSVFFILKGKVVYMLRDASNSRAAVKRDWMYEGDCIFVPRGVVHTFTAFPGTIMLETSSEIYDPQDEIQVTE